MEKIDIVWLAPDSLTPYAKNAKIHSTAQIDLIASQIAAFGFDQPIVVDKHHVIIKGHGRREAALRLGLKTVPVIVSTLDEYEAIAARIGDNKVASAPWDNDVLKLEFGALELRALDLKLTGFELGEIENIRLDPIWASDLGAIDKAGSNTDGITSVIKVSCPQEMKAELKAFLQARVDEQGFVGVEIE